MGSEAPAPELGRVLRVSGLLQLVRIGDRVLRCEMRGRLKDGRRTTTAPVYVGDWVRVRPTGRWSGVIESVQPRTSSISRCASGGRGRQQIIAVNIDQLVVIVVLRRPAVRPGFIDRAIIMGSQGGARVVVCVNKIDLGDGAELADLVRTYGGLGYSVLGTSAVTGDGIEALGALIAGCTSAFVGQSGVGKSSLLNCLEPGLNLRTQELMRRHERGRHTTAAAQLHELRSGGWVVDTPGIKELGLWNVGVDSLAEHFVEMRPYVGSCRFGDCRHLEEPGCAVLDAVHRGAISPRRYAGYRRILESL